MIRVALAVAFAVPLSSCSLSEGQRDEVADIAGDVAADPDEVAALQAALLS